MSNIYYRCNQFRLIIAGETYILKDEPIGWDGVNFHGKRDEDKHGLTFQFTDGEVLLKFTCGSGKELIEAEYSLYGPDADIGFQFGEVDENDVFSSLFDGEVGFKAYKVFETYVECNVMKREYSDKLRTRFDTKVPLDADETLDGTPLTPLTPISLELPSKIFTKEYYSETLQNTFGENGFELPEVKKAYIQTGFDNVITNELEEAQIYPTGISINNPLQVKKYNFFHNDDEGIYDYYVDVSGEVYIELIPDTNIINSIDIAWYIKIGDMNPPDQIGISSSNPNDFKDTVSFSHSYSNLTYTSFKSDEVYIWGEVDIDVAANVGAWYISIDFDPTITFFKVIGDTKKYPTYCNTYFIHEAINRNLEVITDTPNVLYSEFLGRTDLGYIQNGCGSKNMITNGSQIKQLPINERPPVLSMKDNFNSLKSRWNFGLGIETIGGERKIRMEPASFFYQDKEIFSLSNISSYSERPAYELIHNEIEIGYKKFLDEDINSLDEFNTTHQYLTPITKAKSKLSLMSDYIASGYAIEYTRRQIDKPTETSKFDKDIFIISVRHDGMTWVVEHDEPFDTVNNVISPETSYNLRHSPLRMLFEHATFINSGLFYKPSDNTISFRDGNQNYFLETQFNAGETCNLGDPGKLLWREGQDITLSTFNQFKKLFVPIWMEIECTMSFSNASYIANAMQGNSPDDNNYGYLTAYDYNGNAKKGFLYTLDYMPATEKATILLLMKNG